MKSKIKIPNYIKLIILMNQDSIIKECSKPSKLGVCFSCVLSKIKMDVAIGPYTDFSFPCGVITKNYGYSTERRERKKAMVKYIKKLNQN